jgi:hypothetical protein
VSRRFARIQLKMLDNRYSLDFVESKQRATRTAAAILTKGAMGGRVSVAMTPGVYPGDKHEP